jgi:hypothetical protein
MGTHEPHETRGPHAGGNAFSADVAQGDDHGSACLFNREKIAGQVANGEDLAGNFNVPVPHQPRRAETPVNLRRLEQRRMEIRVILLQRRKLLLQLTVLRPKTRAEG